MGAEPRAPIVVTGCQRSGTTLLHLILDSHPDIVSHDELEVPRARLAGYARDPAEPRRLAFKLPTSAHDAPLLEELDAQLLWMVRDPRDVVRSMLRLHLPLTPIVSVAWAAHPDAAWQEIRHGLGALPAAVRETLAPEAEVFERSAAMNPAFWQKAEAVHAAALCWRIKSELPQVHALRGNQPRLVHYEHLCREPRRVVGELLAHLDLPWHDDVLRHHALHSGVSIGATDNTRSIDASSVGTWQDSLDGDDLAVVRRLCSDAASRLGYEL